MTDREKVIKGLECCRQCTETDLWGEALCSKCPYITMGRQCVDKLMTDALALILEQKAVDLKEIGGEST